MIHDNGSFRLKKIGNNINKLNIYVSVVCSFVLVVQMFFLSLLSSYLLAPHRCALFDNFPSRKETLSQVSHSLLIPQEGQPVFC